MYGAILGDIIGSPFEFDRGSKTKEFELFSRGCGFTDDSVMTVAIAEALLAVGPDADESEIKEAVAANMQDWGRRYPHAGYGGKFRQWLKERNPKPYGSYGNGSAMRVSAAGWLYPTIERTREVAELTAAVTHNHPEGIKGAVATASCIFLARNGASKDEIRKYVEDEFHYNLNRTLDEIRPFYHHVESCQQTVPEAITAFMEAKDFEDAIRNAVSLGGDTDTLAAITGSIAEAFFGIPAVLKAECRDRIDPEMCRVLEAFDEDRITIDIQSGVVENSVQSVKINVVPMKNGKGYIVVNDYVLDLIILDLPIYDSNYRFTPYKLLFAKELEIVVNDDCKLKNILFNNLEFSQTAIRFELIFNILDTVRNSFETFSVTIPAIIDLQEGLLLVRDKKIALPTVLEYTKESVSDKNNKS